MQSTSTRSRSSSSRRSSGSKRASCSRAAAPRSQAATKALRADSDQPLAAVHQHRSPGWAPYQCSACTRWPAEIALAVADWLGLARRARGEHDQRRIVGVEVRRRRRLGVEQPLVGQREGRPLEAGRGHRLGVALVHHTAAGPPAPAGPAGQPGAAARSRAGPRRRSASRRPWRRPIRAGCRSASSPRRPVPPRARPASRPAAPSDRPPRRRRPPGARLSRDSATSAGRPGSAASTISRAKFTLQDGAAPALIPAASARPRSSAAVPAR